LLDVYVVSIRGIMEYVFFFQAEVGIRDRNVTGVQTCALPIFLLGVRRLLRAGLLDRGLRIVRGRGALGRRVRRDMRVLALAEHEERDPTADHQQQSEHAGHGHADEQPAPLALRRLSGASRPRREARAAGALRASGTPGGAVGAAGALRAAGAPGRAVALGLRSAVAGSLRSAAAHSVVPRLRRRSGLRRMAGRPLLWCPVPPRFARGPGAGPTPS